MICDIYTKQGVHYAIMVVNDIRFVGQGWSNTEALDNAFEAYYKSTK